MCISFVVWGKLYIYIFDVLVVIVSNLLFVVCYNCNLFLFGSGSILIFVDCIKCSVGVF